MSLLGSNNNVDVIISNKSEGSGFTEAKKGIEAIGNATDEAGGRFTEFAKKSEAGFKKVSVVTGVLAAGVTLYAKNATDYVVSLVKDTSILARQTGMTTESTSLLLAVTKKMGLTTQDTSAAFGVLSKQIVATNDATGDLSKKQAEIKNKIEEAQIKIKDYTADIKKNGDSSGELRNKVEGLKISIKDYTDQLTNAKTPLEKLGVATKTSSGETRNFNDVLMDIADRFKGMKDGSEKTALSMELFGKKGKDLIKTLNLGSDGIKDMELQAQKLGLTLSSKNVADVAKYVKAQKDMKDQTDALKLAVGSLTMPVLAAFQERLNSVAMRLIATDSPFKGIIANALAFGGPVLTGTSALTGFLGNLSSALPLLEKFGPALTNPWVLGGAAVVGVVAAVTYGIMNQKTASEQLALAQANLKQKTDEMRVSQQTLKDAQLAQVGASLNVEQAQKSYNEAVKRFGPNSLEARQALYNLQVAQQNLKTAQDQTKDSQQRFWDKQKEVAKEQALIRTMQTTSREIDGVKRSADGAVVSINKLVEKVQTKTAGGTKIDLSPLLKRAKGGPVKAGQPYIVGDNPDGSLNPTSELFVPNQSGTIIPGGKTNAMFNNNDSESGGGSKREFNHYGDVYLGDSSAVAAYFAQHDENNGLASKGITTNKILVGGF
jgi:hypothetical protein